jgi:hypothetical protein
MNFEYCVKDIAWIFGDEDVVGVVDPKRNFRNKASTGISLLDDPCDLRYLRRWLSLEYYAV